MGNPITIQELLNNRGLNEEEGKILLMRHKSDKWDLYNLYLSEREKFLKFQSQQVRDIFNNFKYLVSFIGEKGRLARFIGVYKVNGVKKYDEIQYDSGNDYIYLCDLEEVEGFEELKERIIIDWGKGTVSWHQDYRNAKNIVEIQPGLHFKQFKDYLDFVLSFDELKEIINNNYPVWKKMLSAVFGVYLILDKKTGKQYIGSAYGEENGIWGRWEVYVKTNGHGDNKQLVELINKDPDYAKNFQFTILEILPKSNTCDQATDREKLLKMKLGTKTLGLNSN